MENTTLKAIQEDIVTLAKYYSSLKMKSTLYPLLFKAIADEIREKSKIEHQLLHEMGMHQIELELYRDEDARRSPSIEEIFTSSGMMFMKEIGKEGIML